MGQFQRDFITNHTSYGRRKIILDDYLGEHIPYGTIMLPDSEPHCVTHSQTQCGTQRAITCGPHVILGHVVTLWYTMWCVTQCGIPQRGTTLWYQLHHIVHHSVTTCHKITGGPHCGINHIVHHSVTTCPKITCGPHCGINHIVYHSVTTLWYAPNTTALPHVHKWWLTLWYQPHGTH